MNIPALAERPSNSATTPDDRMLIARVRVALTEYDTTRMARRNRLDLWRAVREALQEAGYAPTRATSQRPTRCDNQLAQQYESRAKERLSALTTAERVHWLFLSAPTLGDPEWPSLLNEIIEEDDSNAERP